MLGGYSFFEGIFKRDEKESFLKEKINERDSVVYTALKYSLYGFMVTNVIFLLIILFKGIVPDSAWYFVGATVLNAITRQWHRRYLLVKYGYEKKSSFVKKSLFVLITLFSILAAMYGLIKLLLYLSQF